MASFVVPPGGFAGFSQMTPASRQALSPMERAVRRSSRRQGVKITPRKRKKKASRARARAGSRKMKFGSPAWQKKYRVGKFAKK